VEIDPDTISNVQLSDLLFRMAELVELEGSNPFRARAYRRGATTIRNLPFSAAERVAAGQTLEGLPGIGDDLDHKIGEACRTGRLSALDELEATLPPGLVALSAIPGIGPKRLRRLREELGVTSIDALRRAATAGRIRRLAGFGPGFEARVLRDTATGSA
jgi:DNA polymerase (family 10)